MSIFRRILLAFGILIAIGTAQSAFLTLDLWRLSGRVSDATTVPLTQVDNAHRVSALFNAAKDEIAETTSGIRFVDSDAARARFDAIVEELEGALAELETTPMGDAAQVVLEDLHHQVDGWASAATAGLGPASATEVVSPHVQARREAVIRKDVVMLIDAAKASATEIRAGLIAETDAALTRALVAGGLTVLLGIGLALV